MLGEEPSRGDVASQAVGVRLASETAAEALLLVVPHGEEPCLSSATFAIPIQPSLDRYGSPMGGATGAAWARHQGGVFEASLP